MYIHMCHICVYMYAFVWVCKCIVYVCTLFASIFLCFFLCSTLKSYFCHHHLFVVYCLLPFLWLLLLLVLLQLFCLFFCCIVILMIVLTQFSIHRFCFDEGATAISTHNQDLVFLLARLPLAPFSLVNPAALPCTLCRTIHICTYIFLAH